MAAVASTTMYHLVGCCCIRMLAVYTVHVNTDVCVRICVRCGDTACVLCVLNGLTFV